MSNLRTACALLLLVATTAYAQQPSSNPPSQNKAVAPAKPETAEQDPTQSQPAKAPNRADAYYHYTLAHIYEELVAMYGRSEFAGKAIDEYRAAIEADPHSEFLNSGLAELFAKTGRIRDAVLEAQDILKRDPNNLEARKLLGRIYLRSLGDLQSGTQSRQVLKLAIEQYEQIVKIEPSDPDNHLLLGRLYILNKEMGKAEDAFKQAVKLQPDSEEALTHLAYLYNELGQPQRAISTLTAVPEEGRSAKLYQALGYTYEQQKDYKKAIDAYRKAVDLDKDNLDSVRGLAQNLLNDNQTEAALEQYRAIADADPQDVQVQLRISDIYRSTGRFDQALAALRKAATLVQDSQEIPYKEAQIYEAEGRYDEAAKILQDLIDKNVKPDGNYNEAERNNRAIFLERLGSVYRSSGKTQQALETFRKMIELGSDPAERGYTGVIDTYREAKQWPEANAAAKEAVQKFPENRDLRLTVALQMADAGQGDQGIAMLKPLLKGNSDDRDVYLTMSQVESRQKHWKEAEEYLQSAEKLGIPPEGQKSINFLRGSYFERQKKFEQAEEMFRKVLAVDPQNAMTLNYLGYMLADRGVRLPEALELIKKAVAVEPQSGAYLDSLGWVYFKLGNYDQAEENLRKALTKIGNDATIHEHLGDLYQKTGRLKLATAHWERSLEEWSRSLPSDVDQNDVAKIQKKLESARIRLAQQQTK